MAVDLSFPGRDGVLGTADNKYITTDNPFGINPADPYARDDILIDTGELHLPINEPVKVTLRSKDVLHDFYVPQFRAKMDLVPGTVTYFWFEPTKEGTFEVLCAEHCGTGHYAMRGSVVVEGRESFNAWLAEFPTFGELFDAQQEAIGAGAVSALPQNTRSAALADEGEEAPISDDAS